MASSAATTISGLNQQVGCIGHLIYLLPALGLVVGYFANPAAALRSYLWVYLYLLSVPVGALAIVMLQHLTGGAWGVIIRRPCEAAMRTFPIMAVLFLPIAFGVRQLYPWAEHDAHVPFPRSMYLNVPWFWIRAASYFAVWIGLSSVLNRWSMQQDEANPPGFERRFRLLSGPGLGLIGLSVTFASIDWSMSLEPDWFSSLYGVQFGVGMVLSAFAFCIVVVLSLADQRPYRAVLVAGHLRDLGSLLLAFVMIWGYLTLAQFLLIWMANIKEEAPYYVARMHGGWQYVIGAVILTIFVMPFLVLLTRDGKRNARSLMMVAISILAARLFELYWLVAPGRPIHDRTVLWTDVVAPLAMIGPWVAYYCYLLMQRPRLPLNVDASCAEDHHG